RLALAQDVEPHHVLARLAARAALVAAPLIERAGGTRLLTTGPFHLGFRRGHADLSVHAGARRRLSLAGVDIGPVGVDPVVVHDDADDFLDRVGLVVVDGHLESETAAAGDLHPV